MAQNEFTRSMMGVIDAYYQLKRSRALLKAFWNEFHDFSFVGLSEKKAEELSDLIFLLDTYDRISSEFIDEIGEIVTDSEKTLDRMREAGEFITQHE